MTERQKQNTNKIQANKGKKKRKTAEKGNLLSTEKRQFRVNFSGTSTSTGCARVLTERALKFVLGSLGLLLCCAGNSTGCTKNSAEQKKKESET